MTIYKYYVSDPTNINLKITQLTNKINIDLDINSTLIDITYDVNQIITINFNTALTNKEIIILSNLVNSNIFGLIPGEDFQTINYNSANRDSYSSQTNPTINHDIGNYYVPGSIIINNINNEAFICVKNDLSNAVWTNITTPIITNNIDNTTSVSTNGNTYKLLNVPTGSTGNYILHHGPTGTYTFEAQTDAKNILGSTGSTDPNGITNPSDYITPVKGDQYYNRVTGKSWIYNGTSWDDIISGITGPTGPTGLMGSIGPTGLMGPTGPTGSFQSIYFSANSPTTISSGTVTSWTEVLDSTNSFNPTNGTYTVPSNGLYFIRAQITFSSQLLSAFVTPVVNISVNGSIISSSSQSLNLSLLNTYITSIDTSIIAQQSAGDLVTVTVSGNSNLNLYTTDGLRSSFYIFKYA